MKVEDIKIGQSYMYFHARDRNSKYNMKVVTIKERANDSAVLDALEVFRGNFFGETGIKSVFPNELWPIPEGLIPRLTGKVKPEDTQPKPGVKLINLRA